MDDALAGRRVLIVEDEYVMASELSDAFGDAGAQVAGPAPSVAVALELLDSQPDLDLAVLDVNLGGETVYPVADALMQRGAPFLFTAGHDASAIPTRFKGVVRLEKPVSPAAILRAAGRALAQRQQG
jgi:CheY-like chemotaxis protein